MPTPGITIRIQHPWDVTPQAAATIQNQLASQVIYEGHLDNLTSVAGVDASYQDGMAYAAIVVLAFPSLEILDHTVVQRPVSFPYVPGLLSFREAPAVLDALMQLKTIPDVLIFDGHGIAHPRRLGIASHMGLVVDLPAIGCAKSRLCGSYEEPGTARGDTADLRDGEQTIGAVVRTRAGVHPVFVSIGHRLDLSTAVETVLACGKGYRLPEPTRLAHRLAGRIPRDSSERSNALT